MPKVRILSGSQAGAVVEMDRTSAESAVGSGYAESVLDVREPEPVADPESVPPPPPGVPPAPPAGTSTPNPAEDQGGATD